MISTPSVGQKTDGPRTTRPTRRRGGQDAGKAEATSTTPSPSPTGNVDGEIVQRHRQFAPARRRDVTEVEDNKATTHAIAKSEDRDPRTTRPRASHGRRQRPRWATPSTTPSPSPTPATSPPARSSSPTPSPAPLAAGRRRGPGEGGKYTRETGQVQASAEVGKTSGQKRRDRRDNKAYTAAKSYEISKAEGTAAGKARPTTRRSPTPSAPSPARRPT